MVLYPKAGLGTSAFGPETKGACERRSRSDLILAAKTRGAEQKTYHHRGLAARTLRFSLKDEHANTLGELPCEVNFVWNYFIGYSWRSGSASSDPCRAGLQFVHEGRRQGGSAPSISRIYGLRGSVVRKCRLLLPLSQDDRRAVCLEAEIDSCEAGSTGLQAGERSRTL